MLLTIKNCFDGIRVQIVKDNKYVGLPYHLYNIKRTIQSLKILLLPKDLCVHPINTHTHTQT